MKIKKLQLALIFSLTFLAFVVGVQAQTKFELEGHKLKLPKPITFVGETDKIASDSKDALNHVKEYLAAKTFITTLRIEIHLKGGSDAKKAQTLSEKRALAVAKWLIDNGVDCKRILPVGFGSTKPTAAPANAAANERVEFHNAALRNRAIGGLPLDGGGKTAGEICPSGKEK